MSLSTLANMVAARPGAVLLIGAPGSGKSTLADRLASLVAGLQIISYDACRAELSPTGDAGDQTVTGDAIALALDRLERRCAAGLATIVDATHSRSEYRRVVTRLANRHGLPTHAVLVWAELAVCLAGQRRRARDVPDEVVAKYFGEVRASLPLLRHEGYATTWLFSRTAAAESCGDGFIPGELP